MHRLRARAAGGMRVDGTMLYPAFDGVRFSEVSAPGGMRRISMKGY